MISHPRPSWIVLVFWLALFADAALGQSLSIIRKGESEFWIEAAAPPNIRYVLQASGNLHLWVDINDEVRGQLSSRFDSAGVRKRFFRLTPWTPPAPSIILVLIGDSTVADFIINNCWFNGWGQGIYGYFKPNVRVVNLAMPAYSTKRFLYEAEMTTMLKIRPDFVLVQFGLMDEYPTSTAQITLQEYEDNLKTIVQTIRGFNGTPILITLSSGRLFDDQGKVIPTVPDRCAVMKKVAAELKTHLIDLNQLTMDLFNELGKSGSAYLAWNYIDLYHYSDQGARVIAGLVVNALPDSLGPYLVGIFNPPPKP